MQDHVPSIRRTRRMNYKGYSLVERGSKWYVHGTGEHGRVRTSLKTGDQTIAQRRLIDFVDGGTEAVATDRTVSQIVTDYSKSKTGTERSAARQWQEHFGVTPAAALRCRDIDDFTSVLCEDYKPETVNRYLSVGRAALNAAHRADEIRSVPAFKGVAVARRNFYIATESDFRKLYAVAEPDFANYLTLLLLSAHRPISVYGLTRDRVDLERNLIDMNRPGADSNKRESIIPLTDPIRAIAEATLPGEYLVKRDYRHTLPTIVKRAGVTAEFTAYTVRRLATTLLYEAGIAEPEIMRYTGHGSTNAVMARYNHHRPDYLRDSVKALMSFWYRVTAANVIQLRIA